MKQHKQTERTKPKQLTNLADNTYTNTTLFGT